MNSKSILPAVTPKDITPGRTLQLLILLHLLVKESRDQQQKQYRMNEEAPNIEYRKVIVASNFPYKNDESRKKNSEKQEIQESGELYHTQFLKKQVQDPQGNNAVDKEAEYKIQQPLKGNFLAGSIFLVEESHHWIIEKLLFILPDQHQEAY